MGVKNLPQDQLHIQNCVSFCDEVEALIATSNKKADERDEFSLANGNKQKTPRLGYVQAVLIIAERRRIEPEYAASYLNPQIKQKLQDEWEINHMLQKSARLPFAE